MKNLDDKIMIGDLVFAEDELKIYCTSKMLFCGFTIATSGFRYLRALLIESLRANNVTNIVKEKYRTVADQLEVSPTKIDKAINFCINSSYNISGFKNFNDALGGYCITSCPTVSQILSLLKEYICLSVYDEYHEKLSVNN